MKILWLFSKIFPSMLWAILYDIVMNNCEKNIAEIKSFLWVVLAFEKWMPKSEERGDLWRHIMRGCIDVAWSLWRSIMQVALDGAAVTS